MILLGLAAANLWIVGLWIFTGFNEWLLSIHAAGSIYGITLVAGTPLSMFGLAFTAIGLFCRTGWRWPANLLLNGFGFAANFYGFVVYVAAGC